MFFQSLLNILKSSDMAPMEAEDDEAANRMLANSGGCILCGGDNCENCDNCVTKRRRCENRALPKNMEVPKLRGGDCLTLPSSQNRFALLGKLDIDNDTCNNALNKNTNNSNNNNSNQIKATGKNSDNSTGKRFCPPIILYNVNIKALVDQLEARTPKISFKIKNVNRHKSKLFFSDINVYNEMMALLKEKKINSYSFTPKELRQLSFVVRGLYYKTEVEEIKNALDAVVPNVVSKVTKFNTKHSIQNKKDTGLFLISLLPGKGLKDISHVKYLLNQTIVLERPNRKDGDIQCRRCQLWGHMAKNCNRDFKCVKCDKTHEPGNCTRVAKEGAELVCVNCGESGHPANWRGCESYQKYVDNKKAKIKEARYKRETATKNVSRIFQTSARSPGISYASQFYDVPTSKPGPNQQNGNPVIQFLKLAKYFMEPEQMTLEQEIQKFLNEYTKMSKNVAKTEFQRLLSKVQNSYDP